LEVKEIVVKQKKKLRHKLSAHFEKVSVPRIFEQNEQIANKISRLFKVKLDKPVHNIANFVDNVSPLFQMIHFFAHRCWNRIKSRLKLKLKKY
jgi:hypothetical protein